MSHSLRTTPGADGWHAWNALDSLLSVLICVARGLLALVAPEQSVAVLVETAGHSTSTTFAWAFRNRRPSRLSAICTSEAYERLVALLAHLTVREPLRKTQVCVLCEPWCTNAPGFSTPSFGWVAPRSAAARLTLFK